LHTHTQITITTPLNTHTTTLGDFLQSCEPQSFPFKIIVIRTYPWARVRDDREFKCEMGPTYSITPYDT